MIITSIPILLVNFFFCFMHINVCKQPYYSGSCDHLVTRVAGKLKGLFLLFAGHMIPSCVEVLKGITGRYGSHDFTNHMIHFQIKTTNYRSTCYPA